MTDRLEELVWAELDGELTAEEARELADLRSAHEKDLGSALESEIRELADRLSGIEDVAAPAELKRQILTAIEASRTRADDSSESRSRDVAAFPIPVPARSGQAQWLRWGTLAAGLLIAGVVLYQLTAGRVGSERAPEVIGTVAPAPDPGHPPDGGQRTGLPGSVRLTERDGLLVFSLESGGGDATFVFRAPGLEIDRIDFEDGAKGSYEVGASQVTLRVAGAGRVEARLSLARPERAFTFSGSGSGFEPFEGEFLLHGLSGS